MIFENSMMFCPRPACRQAGSNVSFEKTRSKNDYFLDSKKSDRILTPALSSGEGEKGIHKKKEFKKKLKCIAGNRHKKTAKFL